MAVYILVIQLFILFGLFSKINCLEQHPLNSGWSLQESECGGIIEDQLGLINYKLNKPYDRNELCVWTINANSTPTVQLQLALDGFQSTSGRIQIFTIFPNDHYGVPVLGEHQIKLAGELNRGNRTIFTVAGPVVYVVFSSTSGTVGTGFSLFIVGLGALPSIRPKRHIYQFDASSTEPYTISYNESESSSSSPLIFLLTVNVPFNSSLLLNVKNFHNFQAAGVYNPTKELGFYELYPTVTPFFIPRAKFGTSDPAAYDIKFTHSFIAVFYTTYGKTPLGRYTFDLKWKVI